ncbi:MAG: uncharacterized protein QOE86_1088 [Solirubrobacteraceae bacterium]|nr:uncharacterized protein [Solirubrobacteraceae bacterium]
MPILSKQDLQDILDGACILGAGGGGPYPLGQQLLAGIVEHGSVELVAPEAVGADARLAVAAGVGSPDAAASGFPFDAATHAWDALAATLGQPFTHVLPGEVGAANSLLPMTVAVSKRLPIVDGAGAARAIPALPMCTYASHGLPLGTIVLANADEQISFQAPGGAATADSAMRGIVSSGAFKEDTGVAMWAMDGAAMRSAVIAGTTERARALGATLREAAPGDKVAAVAKALGGRVVFRGAITAAEEQTEGGFDLGTVTLSAPDGATFRIVNQNENLVAWSGAHPHPLVLAPDLICFLTEDGRPFSNADLDIPGHGPVVVIAAPVDRAMRAPALVETFVPALQQAGYGGPYVPVEQLWE